MSNVGNIFQWSIALSFKEQGVLQVTTKISRKELSLFIYSYSGEGRRQVAN